jgi:hypothetical protein
MTIRPMEFAGSWYPAQAEACEQQLRAWWARPLPGTSPPAEGLPAPRVPPAADFGVAPHAGWVFSGALAARTFQALREAPDVALVIVLGGHLRAGDPVVAMSEGAWDTPFGPLPVHTGFRPGLDALAAAGLPVTHETPRRYTADNSTELQLPFVRYRYPRAELLALRVPPGAPALALGRALADYLERAGLDAVGVASTDLTHYGPAYRFEPRGRGAEALRWVRDENDAAFIKALVRGDGEGLLEASACRHNACSAGAVAALNEVARRRGQRFEPLAYATSAEAGVGDGLNFVGYLSGVFR